MTNLCDFEIELLQAMSGLRPAFEWGASTGAALEYLKGRGYVEKCFGPDGITYQVSDKGKEFLKNL